MITINETKVKLLHKALFAYKSGKIGVDTPAFEEVRQMLRAISKDIEGLPEEERADLLNRFFHIVPEDEYDGAVEYLKRTVKPDNMREILEIMERNKKAGVKTDFPFTAKMDIRTMLRHGGFAWKGNYLDDHCQQLLLDAAERFALEHPELEFDL